MDDLLDLLQQAEDALRQSRVYVAVQYTQSHVTIHCECGLSYKGLMTHVEGMDNLYDGYHTKWCPECIHTKAQEWWSHCFRMGELESV